MANYFEGWYFKHQHQKETLCLIPGRSKDTAFIQVITNRSSYHIDFPLITYEKGDIVWVGNNYFSAHGLSLDIHHKGIELTGCLKYGPITPLKYDIMGPFKPLPLQCRHSIISLYHPVEGNLTLNGQPHCFDGGKGYIEGDSGSSFPKSYLWAHSNDFPKACSVTVAVAHIPFAGSSFLGCIGVVWYGGREYRLSTYTGAKIRHHSETCLAISQGRYHLLVEIPPNQGQRLLAPQLGEMTRTIHENASTSARFVFSKNRQPLFDYLSHGTSFEYVQQS